MTFLVSWMVELVFTPAAAMLGARYLRSHLSYCLPLLNTRLLVFPAQLPWEPPEQSSITTCVTHLWSVLVREPPLERR